MSDKYINLTELGRFKTNFVTYLTNNYYTQTQVNNLFSTYKSGSYRKVSITDYPTLASFLASTGNEGFWYLYPKKTSESPTFQSGYYSYIWEDNAWVSLGDTNIDLSDYATKTWCNETFVKLTNPDYTDAVSKKHSHSNKSLLDSYTQTEANLADAVTKKHSHSNKSTLDAIEVAFTTAMNTKLNSAIQGIKINGTAQTPDSNKVVDIDLSGYLEVGATAADSSKLNGQSASYYLNYDNLTNKPTIPTVSNATITIKQTGKSDQTFTLNGSATTITLNDTTYSAATTTAAGLMSATDKSKLDGIASGATAVSEGTVSGWGFTKNAGTVIGSGLTADCLILGNGTVNVKTSTYKPGPSSTTWSDSSDVYLPTMKSVKTYVESKGYTTNTGTVTSVDSISPSSGNVALSAVRYVSQSLTNDQKAQARSNIGAGTSSLTIGTTGSTAAAGNHNHDNTYLPLIDGGEIQSGNGNGVLLTLYNKNNIGNSFTRSTWIRFKFNGQDTERWLIGAEAGDAGFYFYRENGNSISKVLWLDRSNDSLHTAGDIYENGDRLSTKYVAQVSGKGLSTNDYTDADQTKVSNAIQGIKVNNTSQTPDSNKVVNISVPDIVAATDADIDALFS